MLFFKLSAIALALPFVSAGYKCEDDVKVSR